MELLPCPFCGGSNKTDHAENCYLKLFMKTLFEGGDFYSDPLAEAWNRRANPASVPEGAFKAWWNSDTESADNPYSEESSIYWAWEGWCAALAAAPAQPAEDRKDAERLDWLDRNLDFQVGWNVGVAPVGLITMQGVAMRTTTIREAIDQAMQEEG